MKRFWLILAAMMGLAVTAMPASAAVQYTLNCSTAACTGAGGSINYGTVTLTQLGSGSSASVNVSVSLSAGYQFGGNNTDALLWNGLTNDTLGRINVTSGFDSGNIANGSFEASVFTSGSNNEFDYVIQRSNNSGAPTSLSFDVTRTGGLTIANFQTDNDGNGFFFASEIRTLASSTMFYVASNKVIPEPATWALFVAAMAGLTVLYRRRKLARAA
jgi:hypothetical protein